MCRLSRKRTFSTYGALHSNGDGNIIPFHPDLDTIEVLGHGCIKFNSIASMGPLICHEPSEDRGIEDVTVGMGDPVSNGLPVYCGRRTRGGRTTGPLTTRLTGSSLVFRSRK